MSATTEEEFITLAATAMPVPDEVLSFRLGNEKYGSDTSRVRDTHSFEQLTRLANLPRLMTGVPMALFEQTLP